MDELEFGDDETIGQIDWDSVFNENLFPPITVDGSLSDPSPDLHMVEIENLLMEDNDDPVLAAPSEAGAKEYCDQFLADILDGEVEGDSSISDKEVVDASSDKDKIGTTSDDPISKKRTRIPAAGFPAMVHGHHLPTQSPPGALDTSGTGSSATGKQGTERPKKGDSKRRKK